MPVIRDPDFINYGEYDVNSPALDPYTASKNNPGEPAQLLIDYDDRKFALTAPKYGSIGSGSTTLVGFGGTGGVTGQALYSKFKQIWKNDNTAIKFPFPMEAITPESFEFINGWEPDDATELDFFTTGGIATAPAITRKLLRDCGWAERTSLADGNIVKSKYFGIITLGQISRPLKETYSTPPLATDYNDARIYCVQANPGIKTSFDTSLIASNRIIVNNAIVPDMWTGSPVVYQQPTAVSQGIGLTHNQIYYIRHRSTNYASGERPGGETVGVTTTEMRLELYNTQADALLGDTANRVPLTVGAASSFGTLRHQSTAPEFFYRITEEGGAANEAFKFYDADNPVYTLYYNFDNFFKIYCREKGRTYADQAISQVGVSQINYQAYRIPLATSADSNIQANSIEVPDSDVSSESGSYAGIGVSFFQEPISISINDVPYDFNCVIDANNATLPEVYRRVQYLLRNPDLINANVANSGIGFTSINSLSASGGPFGVGVGAGGSFGNDLRYGKTEDLILEFVGTNLFARTRDDIYNETNGGSNYGIYIDNVGNDDLNSVFYYDNTGTLREQPFVSSYTLVFNTNLNEDNDARFWVFFDTTENVPGLSTSFTVDAAGVEGTTNGIDAATDEFVVGAGVSHPFVNGQEIVAISTVSDPGIGITCDTLAAGIVTFQVDNAGATAYLFNQIPADYAGKTITVATNNPTIYIYDTDTAEFDLDTLGLGNHPFFIKEGNASIEGQYQAGVGGSITNNRIVGNGSTTGIITFTPSADTSEFQNPQVPGKDTPYYYICSIHPAMRGNIVILDRKQDSAFKYYVNAQNPGTGIGQTYPDINESGVHLSRVGIGSTTRFKLHRTYLDAVANGGVGINTIDLSVSGTNTGVVTFTQTDVNYEENNATVLRTSKQQSGGQIYLDNIDVPSDGEFGITFDYDFNAQRDRENGQNANVRAVAIGLQNGQYISAPFTIGKDKGQRISVTGALERVYNDPTT